MSVVVVAVVVVVVVVVAVVAVVVVLVVIVICSKSYKLASPSCFLRQSPPSKSKRVGPPFCV